MIFEEYVALRPLVCYNQADERADGPAEKGDAALSEISELLLDWYDAHARTLPWRGIANPYATWVSETMLQQTRVETVLSYYDRFLARFPDVAALAAAPEADVLKLWEGLGYYSRARNLHRGAKQVMADFGGELPRNVSELRAISGVGPYTAGAIASIAYGVPVPAVDGNVIRVVSRVAGVRENVAVPSVRRRIEAEAAAMLPADRPGDFNQALMDLGATVCVPGTPSCERCPLCGLCDAYREGDQEDIPELPRKNPPKTLDYDVCLIRFGDRALMRQRIETMLHGLWVFPMLEGSAEPEALAAAVKRRMKVAVRGAVPCGEAKHVFTHQVWRMKLYAMDALSGDAPEGFRFVSAPERSELAIPTAMRGALRALSALEAGEAATK